MVKCNLRSLRRVGSAKDQRQATYAGLFVFLAEAVSELYRTYRNFLWRAERRANLASRVNGSNLPLLLFDPQHQSPGQV